MKTTKTKSKKPHSVVKELHARREHHARQFDYDPKAIFEDWQRRQEESDRDVVSFPPKRLKQEDAA